MRANEQAKGARTRTRRCRFNSVVIPSSLHEFTIPFEFRLKGYVARATAQNNFRKLPLRIQHSTLLHEKHKAAVKMVMNEREATRRSLKR